jgi:Tfp pilus assembly pilus retraction ATPase PilT
MNALTALLSALELTGGERIVLRSDQLPQLVVGDGRHDLGTATVSTTSALEDLADSILSSAGKQALADQRVAVESLGEMSDIPVRVTVRRIGPQLSVELQRDPDASGDGKASAPAVAVTKASFTSGAHSAAPVQRPATAPASARTQPARKPFEYKRLGTLEPSRRTVETPTYTHDVGGIDDVIRQAVHRKATAVYLRDGHAPVARVGNRMVALSSGPLPTSLVDTVADVSAARNDQRAGPSVWIREHEGVRQRWHAFADTKGPGLVIDLGWQSLEAALERALPRHVKRVCQEGDGIVVVAGTSSTSVLGMISTVGTWTASRRAGFVVSIEPPGGLEQEITGAFVSPRRIGPRDGDGAGAIRRAAQENPDVLIVAVASGGAVDEALRAARAGCLLIVGVVANSATRALQSLLTHVSPQHETASRQALAASFRAAFSYRALHMADGRTKVVHDLLIGTPEVRARLERGDFAALEKCQYSATDGMHSLDAALAQAVRRGDISLRQAASYASDRRDLVQMIRRSARDRMR